MLAKYYRLNDDVRISRRWHLGEILSRDGDFPDLLDCVPCGFTELEAEVSQAGRALEFCQTSFAVPVAGDALADTIKLAAGTDVECVPLRVDKKAGFKAINVLRKLSCVDEKRSQFVKWTAQDHRPDRIGQYHEISDLTIDLSHVPRDVNIFRLWGWNVVLVVSERIKDEMGRAGCFGALFENLKTSNG